MTIDTYVDIGRGLKIILIDKEWIVLANEKLFPLKKEIDFFRII